MWLETIGSQFICHKCIKKHKLMGLVLKTNATWFPRILKKLKVTNYQEFMALSRKQIESVVHLKDIGVNLKTTNVVEL